MEITKAIFNFMLQSFYSFVDSGLFLVLGSFLLVAATIMLLILIFKRI